MIAEVVSPLAVLSVVVAAAALPVLWLSPLSDILSVLAARQTRNAHFGEPITKDAHLHYAVPAHNEEGLIARCAASLVGMRSGAAGFSVTVLPDACTDRTAAVARHAGVAVLDLGHTTPLGKGQLLKRAFEHGLGRGADAIVVIDADSIVDPGFNEALAREPQLRSCVQQAYHGIDNPGESWLTRLAALFTAVRYEGQLPLRAAAGLNSSLTGNGMCFGRDVLRKHGLPCESAKEDLELYARFTLGGVRIVYCPGAVLYAQEAKTLDQARTQRLRWTAGRAFVIRRFAWSLARSRLPVRQRVDALAEVTYQGPILHSVVAAVLAVPLFDSGLHILAVALLASLLPLLAWTVRAIAREEDRWPVMIAFAYLPAYAGWRFAAWLIGLFLESSKTWLRSPRHDPRATAERHLPEVAETRKFSSWVSKRRRDHP